MRVVWVVGGHSTTKTSLEQALRFDRTGTEYFVRLANHPAEIPAEHLKDPGVVVLLDSFHPQFPGFEGLKAIRAMGFKGPAYLFGEPAPESAVEPFKNLGLSGYFPPFERADYFFAGGLIHYQLHFDGQLDLSHFLGSNGKASIETISNLKDFASFGVKLATFVGRFGVDLNQLKKVLMGLSLPHVKTGTGTPKIDEPFKLYYGMDPTKIILAAPGFSKGSNRDALVAEFCDSVATLKSSTPGHSGLFPEIHHVAKSAENLVILAGSAKSSVEAMDPMILMTTIAFPKTQEVQNSPVYVFAFSHVVPTDEMSGDAAYQDSLPIDGAQPPEAPTDEIEAPAAEAQPAGTIEAVDVSSLLSEPIVVGDQPSGLAEQQLTNETPSADAPPEPVDGAFFDSAAFGADGQMMDAGQLDAMAKEQERSNQEIEKLKGDLVAMGQDLRRLMKERRLPSTDRELRDAYAQLEAKLKKTIEERTRFAKVIELKDQEIAALKAQVQDLKARSAA